MSLAQGPRLGFAHSLKGRNIIAQGAALSTGPSGAMPSPEGRNKDSDVVLKAYPRRRQRSLLALPCLTRASLRPGLLSFALTGQNLRVLFIHAFLTHATTLTRDLLASIGRDAFGRCHIDYLVEREQCEQRVHHSILSSHF